MYTPAYMIGLFDTFNLGSRISYRPSFVLLRAIYIYCLIAWYHVDINHNMAVLNTISEGSHEYLMDWENGSRQLLRDPRGSICAGMHIRSIFWYY